MADIVASYTDLISNPADSRPLRERQKIAAEPGVSRNLSRCDSALTVRITATSSHTCRTINFAVIQMRMANVVTLRLPAGKLARVDRRAAELGRDRSGYIRTLIDQDLAQPRERNRHKFASEDLIGAFNLGQGTADNATVRRLVHARLQRRREKNR